MCVCVCVGVGVCVSVLGKGLKKYPSKKQHDNNQVELIMQSFAWPHASES